MCVNYFFWVEVKRQNKNSWYVGDEPLPFLCLHKFDIAVIAGNAHIFLAFGVNAA